MNRQTQYRATAAVIIFHALLLGGGFTVLAATFEFPDILRAPAAERLTLFMEHRNVIVPAYFAMALTGVTQSTIALLLYGCFAERGRTPLMLATLFGILSGVWQIMGFIRWVVLIPYLAEAYVNAEAAGASTDNIIFMEAIANRYIGMAVGEHLGFLGQMLWTALLGWAMLSQRLFEKRLAWIGVILGILHLAMVVEPLGVHFAGIEQLNAAVVNAWVTWVLVLASTLLRTPESGDGPRVGWKTMLWAIPLFLGFTVPAFTG